MTSPQRISKPYLVRTAVDDLLADLAEGDAVPPERELAARFGVSRETVRQALHELLVEGRIERRGRGTVVSRPKLVQPLSLRSYTEGAAERGRVPGRLPVTWEDIRGARGNGGGAGDFGGRHRHARGAGAARRRPAHRVGEHVSAHESGSVGSRETFDPSTSLYAAVRATGVEFGSAVERIETVLPSPREAALLSRPRPCRCYCSIAVPSMSTGGRSSWFAPCTAETASHSRHT